MKKAVIY